jgi:hypothetical protein
VSQELSDAERLRNLVQYVIDPPALGEAVYITKEDAEFVRSIADRLERPAVEGEMYMLETGEWRVRMKYAPRERFHEALGTVHLAQGMPVKVTITPA